MSDLAALSLDFTQFANPSEGQVVHSLKKFWIEQQWEDLIACLTLLQHRAEWRDWCRETTSVLSQTVTNARADLLSQPSFVSWQQILETHLFVDHQKVERVQRRMFSAADFASFALSDGDFSHDTILRPRTVFTITGTGYTVMTDHRFVGCQRKGKRLFVDDEELDVPASMDMSLWEQVRSGDGWKVCATPLYRGKLEIGAISPYLTIPFERGCRFDYNPGALANIIHRRIVGALDILRQMWRDLWHELLAVNRHIVLFREVRRPDTVSSFSNSSVPGTLFICPYVGEDVISTGDALDSLIHEHCHQKLYLLESLVPLYDKDYVTRHRSPWKESPRPIGGILHGYFVFTVLARFWKRAIGKGDTLSDYAARRLREIATELDDAREILQAHCPFTEAGLEMFRSLERMETVGLMR